jgi:hypothetical protein
MDNPHFFQSTHGQQVDTLYQGHLFDDVNSRYVVLYFGVHRIPDFKIIGLNLSNF